MNRWMGCLCGLGLLLMPLQLAAEERVTIDTPTRKAIDRALEWLKRKQNADGSWSEGRYPHNTAITGFAVLAFLSQGHVPNRGPYGPELTRAARFLMASARESDGYLIGPREGNMYCHGMAMLALTQLYGMTGDPELKRVLERAVALTVRCQSPEGGWRYQPRPSGSDISVTIMQVMALRGAKNSGLHVPDATFDQALAYIDRCYEQRSGGYTYQPRSRRPGFARTAAGICVTKLVGAYQREVEKSVDYLMRHRNTRDHFWYGHYYASHAMHQVGGTAWQQYYDQIRQTLLDTQDRNGGWSNRRLDHNSAGPVYQTAIAVIVLSVPSHYLPIFQR